MRLLFSVITLSLSFHSISQKPEAVWYTWNRDLVLEFNVTRDSIISYQYDWDLLPHPGKNYREAIGNDSLIRIQDRLFMFRRIDSSDKLVVEYFVPFRDYKNLYSMMVDTVDTYAPTSKGINITSDTTSIKFPLFVSETELERLESLPSIKKMKVSDFKRYWELVAVETKRIKAADAPDKRKLFYIYFMHRYKFAEIGFNPFFENSQLGSVMKKFSKNPDIKKMLDSMAEE